MSKKKFSTATHELEAAEQVRWRLLLRNLTFQEDMAFLKKMNLEHMNNPPSSADSGYRREAMCDLCITYSNKWALRRINNIYPIQFWPETKHLSLDDILILESHAPLFVKPYEPILISHDPNDEWFARTPPTWSLAPSTRFLFVRLDLSHPIESILPLVEKQIRPKAKHFIKQNQSQLKKIDFQLQVYDRAGLTGESFSVVARELRKPTATIKTAFLLVKKKIDSLFPALYPFSPNQKEPTKKALALASLDPETHVTSCSKCKKAEEFDQMCAQARLFIKQDTCSLPSGTRQPS